MSLKALADAVLERGARAGQGRDATVEKCPTDESRGGTAVPAGEALEMGAEHVIEATFRPAPDVARFESAAMLDHQFPPCPECGTRRYWISRGKVMCGSRTCYSAVRFILTSIEYHPIN
jgi:hypothetical protein